MTAVLEGAHVVLRPAHDDDLDPLAAILAEPEVAPWWPRYDRAKVEEDARHEEDGYTFYVIEVDGEVAGLLHVHEETDPEYRQAAFDIAVGTRWHGQGVAVDALRTICRHLIDHGGHHHLTIDPAAHNVRAIRCYEKVGFRPVGILRQNEMGPDGTFHDALFMDMLASELR